MSNAPAAMELEREILRLAEARFPKTICPSEAARAFSSDETVWRPLMEPVRQAALRLVERGRLQILQRGKVAGPGLPRGAIRLRWVPRGEN